MIRTLCLLSTKCNSKYRILNEAGMNSVIELENNHQKGRIVNGITNRQV